MAKVEVKVNGRVVGSVEVDDTPEAVNAAREVVDMIVGALPRIRETTTRGSIEITVGSLPVDDAGDRESQDGGSADDVFDKEGQEWGDDDGDDEPDPDHDEEEE
jgi:hypothetical protein